jgi:hypothetical protein
MVIKTSPRKYSKSIPIIKLLSQSTKNKKREIVKKMQFVSNYIEDCMHLFVPKSILLCYITIIHQLCVVK